MTSRRLPRRNPERGTVVVLVALMSTTVLAFTALAVDFGYLYGCRRSLQAATDAATMAGLTVLANDQSTTGQSNAATMARSFATANGYTNGVAGATVTVTPTGAQLTVTITSTKTTFFAGFFGLHTKMLTATAVGQLSPAIPAVFAGGTGCPPAPTTGLQLNGTGFSITGDIESNSAVNYYTGGSNTTNGAVTYNPTCGYSGGGNPAPTGGVSPTGGSIPYPYSYTISSFPPCTFGSLSTPGTLSLGGPGLWWATGGPSGGTLVSGVYCANGNIDVSAASVTGTITLVATGKITISSSTANLTGFYNNMIAFTPVVSDCISNQAINIGNAGVTLNGSFDAPNGCVNASGSTMTINGSLVGNEVQIGVGSSSVINSAGGGARTSYLNQ